MIQKTWQTLIKFDAQNGFFKTKRGVIVGLSGGADSVALLHFVKQLSVKRQFDIIALHINHGLRKTAARDEAFAKKTAARLGVKFISKKADVKKIAAKNRLSVEHAARQARYKIFERVAKANNIKTLALGHHADDNAETILLNLLRGTKAKGLLGIPLSRKQGPLNIVRPFLCITRKEVLDYLKAHNLDFVEDETNADDAYTRNWVRQKLLPMLESKQPQIRAHLLLIAQDLAKITAKK